jgi:hypothetical protein
MFNLCPACSNASPSQQAQAPIPYYNVSVLDPITKRAVMTALRYLPNGTKVRVGLGPGASGDIIPIPSPKEENLKIGLCKCSASCNFWHKIVKPQLLFLALHGSEVSV